MNLIFNGLSLSSIILLASLGLAITFGLMRVINMAHGEFMMIGAYTAYVVQRLVSGIFTNSGADIGYFVSIIIAFAVTIIIGSLHEPSADARLYGRESASLLATWGISLILQQAARSIFGTQGVLVKTPGVLSGSIKIAGASLSMTRLFIIVLVAVCLLGVWALMYHTNYGRQMRAVMQNRAMAQCMGINSRKIDNITFAIGSGLAGIAGCSIALLGSIDSTVGQNYIVNTFMAVVLGGVGKLLGTVLGSSIIGFSSIGFETITSSSIAKAIVLLIIIVFLQKKPQGLFTVRSRALDE